MSDMLIILLKAASKVSVILLASPHKKKSDVTSIKGKIFSGDISLVRIVFLFIILFFPGADAKRHVKNTGAC